MEMVMFFYGKSKWLRIALSLALRLSVAAVFVASALAKIRQPFEFLNSVYSYEVFSRQSGLWVAILLPWIELALGLVLFSGIVTSGAFLAGSILSIAFVFVQLHAIHNGLAIACGCFASSASTPTLVGTGTLVRAVGLLLASLAGYALAVSQESGAAATAPHIDGPAAHRSKPALLSAC
jgi:hypothetical protein